LDKICCICGDTLDEENVARCIGCGGYFHFAWSTQAEVRNCGQPWLNPASCGLAFICSHCAERVQADDDQSSSQSAMF